MYALIRSILFMLPPETAHKLSLKIFEGLLCLPFLSSLVRFLTKAHTHSVSCFDLDFSHPVGLAAGFDKNAHHVNLIQTLNFAFIEIGSVTNRPSEGNPKPRLFRLASDSALINRMGLNNEGSKRVAERLSRLKIDIPLFINVAKTPDKSMSEQEIIADYCESVSRLKPYADVMVLNVSCPNADGGRTFEDPELLTRLLTSIREVLPVRECPLVIKISPDLDDSQIRDTVRVCEGFQIDGYTATNTTVKRDGLSTSKKRLQEIGNGGLSGQPLHRRSVSVVRQLRTLTQKPIIGVGGVSDGRSAQEFLDAGATLVQLYSGFVYGGPRVVRKITQEIELKSAQ